MSSSIIVHQCRSWSEFKLTLMENLPTGAGSDRSNWLFRGVADTDWSLHTSFGRKFGWEDGGLGLFKSLLKSFHEASEGVPEISDILTDEWEMMALGQHNGLPTPTLDWTKSPYIAAHFAFHHALSDDPKPESVKERILASDKWVAIWALLQDDNDLWYTPKDDKKSSKSGGKRPALKKERRILLFDGSKLVNERLKRQRGWLSLQIGDQDPLDKFVLNMERSGKLKVPGTLLWKFELPLREAAVAVADMHDMNISAKELMPDHTGRCEHAIVDIVLRNFASR